MLENAKKGIRRIGLNFSVTVAVIIAVQLGVSALLLRFAGDLVEQHAVLMSLGLVVLSVDCIGFPVAWLLNRKLPKGSLGQGRMTPGKYIVGIFLVAGICMIGTLIGLPLHLLCTVPFGAQMQDTSAIAQLMLNSDFWPRVITVGICAPVFEELIFRKILVDRLSHYSKYLAILVSGITFGLFHGNFQQFFFATGLGWFFAFIYVKTGKIIYSIGYHMIVNMTTSVITVSLSGKYLDAVSSLSPEAIATGNIPEEMIAGILIPVALYLGWVLILFLVCLVGCVLLIVYRKEFRIEPAEGELEKSEAKKEAFTNKGLWLIYGICLALFVHTYVPAMFTRQQTVSVSQEWKTVISVEDGIADISSHTIPMVVPENGDLKLKVNWNQNQEAHFVTGFVLRDPEGRVVRTFTASYIQAEFLHQSMKSGEYTVELYILTSPEMFREFGMQYMGFTGDDSDEEGPEEDFYRDGSCELTYTVEIENTYRK